MTMLPPRPVREPSKPAKTPTQKTIAVKLRMVTRSDSIYLAMSIPSSGGNSP